MLVDVARGPLQKWQLRFTADEIGCMDKNARFISIHVRTGASGDGDESRRGQQEGSVCCCFLFCLNLAFGPFGPLQDRGG